ncbi:hypothetical protein HAX54_032767 [Datura stramonium]|uniref:Uncharacterized protein n=1 Tax=Datura stramonium TaxID=4076 RepID=A0ABS8VDX1_DATST|nr:hypothetical protein [Datura stramonium]
MGPRLGPSEDLVGINHQARHYAQYTEGAYGECARQGTQGDFWANTQGSNQDSWHHGQGNQGQNYYGNNSYDQDGAKERDQGQWRNRDALKNDKSGVYVPPSAIELDMNNFVSRPTLGGMSDT